MLIQVHYRYQAPGSRFSYHYCITSMDSHRKNANHITDTYFYEELSKFIGYDASFEWLQISKKSKANSSSTPSPSSQSSEKNTPQQSAATTPRRGSLIQSCPPILIAGHQESIGQQARRRKSDVAETVSKAKHNHQKFADDAVILQITPRQKCDIPEACPQIDQQSNPLRRGDFSTQTTESGILGRIGLLYTDAAHSVLEDRDVAHYIEHANGGPIP